MAKRISEVVHALLRVRELCHTMSIATFGVSPVLEVPEEILELMQIPVVSHCVLQRVQSLVTDPNFISGTTYLNLLPLYLQFVLCACDLHPLQRPDCFIVMKEILQQTPDTEEVVESGRVMSMRRDALDSFLHLMGRGYVGEPMAFLKTLIPTLDATLIRHLVLGLLSTASPPFSSEFALSLCEIMTHKSVREAVSRHFSDNKVLREFCEYILSSSTVVLTPSLLNDIKALHNLGNS